MRIGVPREVLPGETRTALVPALLSALTRDGHAILIERGAGLGAHHSDDAYERAGARIADTARALYADADVIFKVQPPAAPAPGAPGEAELMREGVIYLGFIAPFTRPDVIEAFARRHITAHSVELVPRVSRAQNMDALSSMATVAGYKAVLLATERLGKMLPLLMTAAGTIKPANVMVLGAGVAGLQAIATAKRLGARVSAFDPRPAVKEQTESLGATFINMELPADVETAGGYAKEQSADFLKREMEAIAAHLPETDVVISTAQVFGKRAPVLVSASMLTLMRTGSVLVDLAAEQGGNCEATVPGATTESNGVTIIGAVNLPALLPVDASLLYAHNLINLFRYLYPAGKEQPDATDEIVAGTCVTRGGEIAHAAVREAVSNQPRKVEVLA